MTLIDDRFEVGAPLGKGAFASVFRAKDHADGGREVALKLLLEQHAGDEKKLKRFIQEAKILERLEHPNIAKAIAWSAKPENAYLAMELVDGETLDARLKEHAERNSPLPKEGIAWIADQLAAAVSFAHAQTIVHRDLKPRNVMISRRNQRPFLKVLDFGIAKVLLGSELDPTTVGKVLGSVLYIAPEQVMGQPIDHRADLFSLGTILYEVITLRRTWAKGTDGRPLSWAKRLEDGDNNSQIAVLRRIARDPRPRPTEERPDLPAAVDEVLARAMAIKADDRYASADELARELRLALIASRSVAPQPPTPKLPEPTTHPMPIAEAMARESTIPDPSPAGAMVPRGGEAATRAPEPAPKTFPTFKSTTREASRATPPERLDPPASMQLTPPEVPVPATTAPATTISSPTPEPDDIRDTLRRPRKTSRLALIGALLLTGATLIAALAWLLTTRAPH